MSATAVATGTWVVDQAHSKVGFAVKHMGIATVRGEFTDFEGAIELSDDWSSAHASGAVKAASVDTSQAQRDEHLRSPEFFDVDNHEELRFESTKIEPASEDTYTITGDLTMHGVTKEIVLSAEAGGTDTGPKGEERAGFEVTGELSREDFGMRFNAALGSGNAVVADKVKLTLDISAIKQA